jgi:transposase-like protein
MRDWLSIIFYYSKDLQIYQICELIPALSKKTICNCIKALRLAVSNAERERLKVLKLGSEVECGSIVEIDESLFGKKTKNNRGKKFQRSWVFGLVDRSSNNVVLKIVEKRDSQTLIPIITENVSNEAVVYHDDWAVYRKLEKFGYKHKVVIHSKEFKSKDGTHTNTIEGIWGVLKQRLGRMHGLRHTSIQMFLNEYSFRFHHRKHVLTAICNILSKELVR